MNATPTGGHLYRSIERYPLKIQPILRLTPRYFFGKYHTSTDALVHYRLPENVFVHINTRLKSFFPFSHPTK